MITNPFKKTVADDLQTEIDRLHETLKNLPPASEEYNRVSDQVVKLRKLQSEVNSKKRVSPDAVAAALTNLTGIMLVLNYEKFNIITTKAFGMIVKNIK